MVWIRSKHNGNVFDVEDVDRAQQLVDQGHEAFDSDPRQAGAKPLRAPEVSSGVPIDVQPKQAGSTPPAKYPAGEPQADGWTVKQLKAYAEDHGVDLDGARTKPEILAALLTAGEDDDEDLDEPADDELDDEDEDDESDAPAGDEDETESKDS